MFSATGASTAGNKTVLDHAEPAGDKRKQVGRLYKRSIPYNSVPPIAQNLARGWISIRQEHRVTLRIGDYFGAEFGHDIRPVEIKSDLSKPLGFALSAKHATDRKSTRLNSSH